MSIDLDDYLKDELAQDLLSEKSKVRRDAVTVLARLGSGTRTLEILKGVADSDPDDGLRGHARASYGELWERVKAADGGRSRVSLESNPTMLDYDRYLRMLRDESPIRRLRAVLEAIHLGDNQMLQPSLERLEIEDDDWVLATLVKAIGRSGGPPHIEKIQRFLTDLSRPRLVANTIEAVAMLDPQGAKARIGHFMEANDSRVQATAAMVLFRTDRQASLDTFKRMTKSPIVRTREAAIYFLGRLDDTAAHDLLLGMLLTEHNYNITERVVNFFSQRGDVTVGAKALKISFLQSGVAACYAYRRIARSVSERLQISDAKMSATVTDVEMDLFLRKLAPERSDAPDAPAAGRKTGRVAVVATASPGSRVALAAFCLIVIAGAGVALFPGSRTGVVVTDPGGPVSSVTPASLATSNSPASFTNARVVWDGVVEKVQGATRTLEMRSGSSKVSAVFDSALPDIAPGDRVKVSGKIAGRSRFGPIMLKGYSIVKVKNL